MDVEEIRNFVISIYDGTEKVWSSDKVLKCCKDLLAALAERDKICEQLEKNGEYWMNYWKQRAEQAGWNATYWEDMAKSEMKEREQAEARVKELEKQVNTLAYIREELGGEDTQKFMVCPCCLIRQQHIVDLETRLAAAREGLEEIRRVLAMGHTIRERESDTIAERTLGRIGK